MPVDTGGAVARSVTALGCVGLRPAGLGHSRVALVVGKASPEGEQGDVQLAHSATVALCWKQGMVDATALITEHRQGWIGTRAAGSARFRPQIVTGRRVPLSTRSEHRAAAPGDLVSLCDRCSP